MANFNFNKVIIGGRLTADPELKTTQSGTCVTTFTVAVNRKYTGKNDESTTADFFNVTAWRSTAEFVTKYFKKASSICVVGSLQNRNWTDANGQKHYATDIIADEVSFVDAKNEAPASAQSGEQSFVPTSYNTPAQNAEAPHLEELSGDDEELPF